MSLNTITNYSVPLTKFITLLNAFTCVLIETFLTTSSYASEDFIGILFAFSVYNWISGLPQKSASTGTGGVDKREFLRGYYDGFYYALYSLAYNKDAPRDLTLPAAFKPCTHSYALGYEVGYDAGYKITSECLYQERYFIELTATRTSYMWWIAGAVVVIGLIQYLAYVLRDLFVKNPLNLPLSALYPRTTMFIVSSMDFVFKNLRNFHGIIQVPLQKIKDFFSSIKKS
jgi:hypothetical protein